MIHNKPKCGYGYIYKYTSPSGKSYIGQTIDSLYIRAGGPNGKRYNKCPVFYKAIQKYGFKNFEVEILIEAPQTQLDELEKKYIEIFNTQIPDGYNVTNGGSAQGTKTVYQYDSLTGAYITEYPSIIDASKAINRESQGIVDCTHGRKLTCGNYCWSLQKLEKYPLYEKQQIIDYNSDSKTIQMYDLEGNFIRSFKSISEAATFCGGERSAIKRCCRHELKSYKGYKWECSEVLSEKKYNNSPKAIDQLDKESGEKIQTYISISAAARAVHGTNSGIRRVLNNDHRSAYGFKWKYTQGSTTISS